MKIDFNKKYTTISVYCIITFTICVIILMLISKIGVLVSGLALLFKVLAPIIWGIVIAFLINPIQKFFEHYIKILAEKKKPHPLICRWSSVILSVLITLAFLSALVAIIIPQVIDSVISIINSSSDYFSRIESWAYGVLEDYPELNAAFEEQFEGVEEKIVSFADGILPKLGNLAIKIKDGAISLVIGLKDFVIGFIVAIYLLVSREKFLAQSVKLSSAIFPKKFNAGFLRVCGKTNRTLSGFISGKLIDSLIIGILCFICLKIMGIDMPLLISFIVGITNIIPFFGPIFGAIPCGFLLLMTNPRQVIPFVIFIIILQQFDGNILGPKILGDSTGLPAFWVMFAIIVGGGLFGFAGMVLSVPLFAVVYELVSEFINMLLKKKQLSVNTADYYPKQTEVSYNKKYDKFKAGKCIAWIKSKLKKNKTVDSENKDAGQKTTDTESISGEVSQTEEKITVKKE